tara:strand:+ start:107 stop:574 length:468 start_codon:yes stop_codon:yes gene_type:complete
MIIICNNCNKKFEVDSNLIPQNGRLVQCNNCNNKWLYKKEITNKPVTNVENQNLNIKKTESTKFLDDEIDDNLVTEKIIDKKETNDEINSEIKSIKKNYNILKPIIVFIISFIGLVIILDTFKSPISKMIPNIEFMLYNLYESIKDFFLFIKDLI